MSLIKELKQIIDDKDELLYSDVVAYCEGNNEQGRFYKIESAVRKLRPSFSPDLMPLDKFGVEIKEKENRPIYKWVKRSLADDINDMINNMPSQDKRQWKQEAML